MFNGIKNKKLSYLNVAFYPTKFPRWFPKRISFSIYEHLHSYVKKDDVLIDDRSGLKRKTLKRIS